MGELLNLQIAKEIIDNNGFVEFMTLDETHLKLLEKGFHLVDKESGNIKYNGGFHLFYVNHDEGILIRIKTHGYLYDDERLHHLRGHAHLTIAQFQGSIYKKEDEWGFANKIGNVYFPPHRKSDGTDIPNLSKKTDIVSKTRLELKYQYAAERHFLFNQKHLDGAESLEVEYYIH